MKQIGHTTGHVSLLHLDFYTGSLLDKLIYLDFSFIPRKDDLFDAAKDIVAVERRLKLGLTNPIMEIEARGYDVDDVLDGWSKWNEKLKKHNLTFGEVEPLPLDVVNQLNEESNRPELINDEENTPSDDK